MKYSIIAAVVAIARLPDITHTNSVNVSPQLKRYCTEWIVADGRSQISQSVANVFASNLSLQCSMTAVRVSENPA